MYVNKVVDTLDLFDQILAHFTTTYMRGIEPKLDDLESWLCSYHSANLQFIAK